MRYTEYHAGKAVIKDKNKLAEAMEKLAEFEEKEKCGEWLDAIELAKLLLRYKVRSGFRVVRDFRKNQRSILSMVILCRVDMLYSHFPLIGMAESGQTMMMYWTE